MAPATRRSSGLGSHASGQSNLDHILEHFNQFKRKHITQNRDIIKTNALAQLRIKELEDKVLALEAERATCKLNVIRMQSRLERAESAACAVRKGWQLVGAGIAALSAVEGFDVLMRDDSDSSDARYATLSPYHIRPSTRITLDPNALPGGVARNVARAPELGLNDLQEETSAEMSIRATQSQTLFDDEATREDGDGEDADDDEDDEEDDASHHGDGDTVSFSVDDDTIRMNGSTDVSGFATQQQVTPTITLTNAGRSATGSVTMDRRLNRMTSIDSLSSFADDEEIELSTDDDDDVDVDEAIVTQKVASAAAEQRLSVQSAIADSDGSSLRAKGAGRKRKSPSSPGSAVSRASSVTSTPDEEIQTRAGRRRGYDAGEDEQDEDDGTMSASQSEDDTYFSSSRESRHSRRSSMRDRKSVNYALPKLNTKMRKPDPVDLVPAARGEARRRHGSEDASDGGAVGSSSGTSHEEGSGRQNDDTAASSAGDEHHDELAATEAARIRTLKGKHEVASTGNLRDLRQKHQRQQEYAARRDGVHAAQDDALSSSSREHSEATDEAHNESPRRRSSRKSLHSRRSSSSFPASEQDEGDVNGDSQREPATGMPSERSKPTADAKTLVNGGSSAVPSTPKWRAHTSTTGAGRTLPSVTGTPIPRPTVRAPGGNAQGIKALSVAGRMQRAPPSTTISQQQQQRAAIGINGGKANTATANGVTASNNVLGSSARVNSSQPQQRAVSAGHAPQSTPTANSNGGAPSPTLGDPTKRNSLHAALTSSEAFATLSASLVGVRTNGSSSSD